MKKIDDLQPNERDILSTLTTATISQAEVYTEMVKERREKEIMKLKALILELSSINIFYEDEYVPRGKVKWLSDENNALLLDIRRSQYMGTSFGTESNGRADAVTFEGWLIHNP